MTRYTGSLADPVQGSAGFSGRVAPLVASSTRIGPRRRHRADRRMHASVRALEQKAGPAEPSPSYESIDIQPINRAIMSLFRRKMVVAIGHDSEAQGCGPLEFS